MISFKRSYCHQFKPWSKMVLALLVFALPASTNYQLRSYGFGGGGESAGSTNYQVEGILGELSNSDTGSTNYQVWSGLSLMQQSDVPLAPTVVNDSDYTNKLHITINKSDNPSNDLYAIAVSSDNFTTTEYVQSDNTVGATLGSEDWQSYTDWGGASGEFVVGLAADTTYDFKVKAMQGDFSESPWSPTAEASTSTITLSFDIDVASTDTETAAPYSLSIGNLSAGSIVTSSDKIWLDLNTNAASGGYVYIFGSNSGLRSASTNYTISAVSGNLSSLGEGIGWQSATDTETSGGPLLANNPFDGASETVGAISSTPQVLYSTSSLPIVGGRGSVVTKAKITSLTPAATDYSEVITFIAAGSF